MEKMNIQQVAVIIAKLVELGIHPEKKPTFYRAYRGAWGSISNYKEIVLGEITEYTDLDDSKTYGVYVSYEEYTESGDDFCDHRTTDCRTVRLEDLIDYLRSKGIK